LDCGLRPVRVSGAYAPEGFVVSLLFMILDVVYLLVFVVVLVLALEYASNSLFMIFC
jgi:hypothetical protein